MAGGVVISWQKTASSRNVNIGLSRRGACKGGSSKIFSAMVWPMDCSTVRIVRIGFEHGQKADWGSITCPPFSCVFALFLLFQKFAFAGDVAAVALGGDVLAKGETVEREMIFPPMAPWMAILNIWRGISSFSLLQATRARPTALSRWISMDRASTRSPLIRISSLTRSVRRYSISS
jgi:hypothetical protein